MAGVASRLSIRDRGRIVQVSVTHCLTPFPGRSNQPKSHQAEPEIHQRSQVNLKAMVSGGRWKMRHEQKIHNIPQNNRDQRFKEISDH
jgi:hypothetical protein